MYQKEKNRTMLEIINNDFNQINLDIINSATSGKIKYQFHIQCKYQLDLNNMCHESKSLPFFNTIFSAEGRDLSLSKRIAIIKSNELILKIYTHKLLEKLNNTFPDSKITQIHKPCCDYIISWGNTKNISDYDKYQNDFY